MFAIIETKKMITVNIVGFESIFTYSGRTNNLLFVLGFFFSFEYLMNTTYIYKMMKKKTIFF